MMTHVLFWRLRMIPKRLAPAFVMSFSWLAILAGCLWFLPEPNSGSIYEVPLPATAMALYGLLSLVYINEIVVLRDRSPSLEIMRLVRRGDLGGLSGRELEDRFIEERWVERRLEALVREGYALRRQDRYFLAPRARGVVRCMQAYRSLLARGPGG